MGSTKIYRLDDIVRKNTDYFISGMKKLEDYWHKIGLDDEQFQERSATVLKYTMESMAELVQEEATIFERLDKKFNEHAVEIEQLRSELGLEAENLLKKASDLTLIKAIEYFEKMSAGLRKEKLERIKEHNQLSKTESELIKFLGMPPNASVVIVNRVPRPNELKELRENVRMLTEEKNQRLKKFMLAKQELTTILETTELAPETAFERDIFCYNDDSFVLSSENLQQITLVVKKYQEKQREIKCKIDKAKATLFTLWERLDIPKTERQFYVEKFGNYTQSSLSEINVEINRCEEIKKQNLCDYIDKLRDKILDLWEKCSISKEERLNFEDFNCSDYTDELLNKYEVEIERLEKYHRETENIFKMIEQRKCLWQVMLNMEQNASNPNRYCNRGGNLLLEEKQRKRILKDLPALEKKILDAIGEYEENNNRLFLIEDKNFAELIKEEWNAHIVEKENKRMERQKLRTKQAESPFKTPVKQRSIYTPASAPSKLGRTALTVGRPHRSTGKLLTPKQLTPSALLRQRRKQGGSPYLHPKSAAALSKKAGPSATPCRIQTPMQDTTSYSTFATELNQDEREKCRSSVLFNRKRVFGGKVSDAKRRKSSRKSNYSLRSSTMAQTVCNVTRTPTKQALSRAKAGLPFLI